MLTRQRTSTALSEASRAEFGLRYYVDEMKGTAKVQRAGAVSLILLLAMTTIASAQDLKGEWELGFYSGYTQLDGYVSSLSGDLNPEDDILAGIQAGIHISPRVSLVASHQFFNTLTAFDPGQGLLNKEFEVRSSRLNMLFDLPSRGNFHPFIAAGLGYETTEVTDLLDEDTIAYNAGIGLRWLTADEYGFRFDARYVLTPNGGVLSGTDQERIELTLGLFTYFGGLKPGDADGDGVINHNDRCPDTAKHAHVNRVGCPSDDDGDGVENGIDICADTTAGFPVDAQGCDRDSDKDGVPDGLDLCHYTPRGATIDSLGCPKDTDGDTVWDGLDRCPDTPPGLFLDEHGCPQDSDGDGVNDGQDLCPGTLPGTEVGEKGCKLQNPLLPSAS